MTAITRTTLLRGVAASACALGVLWALVGHFRGWPQGTWHRQAIGATLEAVIPVHNDVWFRYVLENRTDSDYHVADESQIRIFGRSRSTGALVARVGEHVSGEFPLTVPAGQRVHFALIWTTDRDIEGVGRDDLVSGLNVSSFVVLDDVSRYQIELPIGN